MEVRVQPVHPLALAARTGGRHVQLLGHRHEVVRLDRFAAPPARVLLVCAHAGQATAVPGCTSGSTEAAGDL